MAIKRLLRMHLRQPKGSLDPLWGVRPSLFLLAQGAPRWTFRAGVVVFALMLNNGVLQGQGPNRPLFLLYDDVTLSPPARNALAALLAAEPISTWASVEVTAQDKGQYKFVERVFNISSVARNGADKPTADLLITELRRANGPKFETLVPGTKLLVPPVPQRVYSFNATATQPLVRLAHPQSRTASEASSLEQLTYAPPPAATVDPRDGDLTATPIQQTAELVKRAWAQPFQPVLPREVHPFGDNGDVQIRLHGSSKIECDQEQSWLERSPFRTALVERLSTLHTKEILQTLEARANQTPLVIIDWSSSTEPHGKKVGDVARSVLHALGFGNLPITEVNLNPASNRGRLKQIFREFKEQYYCLPPAQNCKTDGQKKLLAEAEAWIDTAPTAKERIVNVKQLVIEAILWKYFKAQPSWVNMSFSIDSPAIDILQAEYLAASQAFGIAAANDEGTPESPTGVPQRAASVHRNFIIATFGTQDGRTMGGTTNPLSNAIVTALGQGCGYEFNSIRKSDVGSSFAAPYVAVLTWIKHLLDGVDAFNMRRELIRASAVAVPEILTDIESGGALDAANLIAGAGAYISWTDGSVSPLRQGKVTVTYKKPNGGEIREAFLVGEGTTLGFGKVGAITTVRIRRFRTLPPPLPVAEVLNSELLDLSVEFPDLPTSINFKAAWTANKVQAIYL